MVDYTLIIAIAWILVGLVAAQTDNDGNMVSGDLRTMLYALPFIVIVFGSTTFIALLLTRKLVFAHVSNSAGAWLLASTLIVGAAIPIVFVPAVPLWIVQCAVQLLFMSLLSIRRVP
jgi:hypothetical protein